MVAVGCLVEKFSRILLGMATGVSMLNGDIVWGVET